MTRTTTRTDPEDLAARCTDAAWERLSACAEQTGTWAHGSWALSPSRPRVWDHNLLRVERLPRHGAPRRIASAAEAVLGGAGLAHRKLVCDAPDLGARLAPGLEALGWRAESLAVLAWRGEGPAARGTARELGDDEARALHEEISRVAYGTDPATAAELARAGRGGRVFGAPTEEPRAFARLWEHGGVGEIDDVAVLPAARRRGLGRSVVLAALAAARTDVVFLRADEHDWPWSWYARLGFAVVGRQWSFVRPGA